MWKAILAVAAGSAIGGLMRWGLSFKLNALFPEVPLGTLTSNLIAAYVVGAAIGYFSQAPGIAPEWRLIIVTGFCGGLSTFSTFSGEVVLLLQEGRASWALGAIALHVCGSLLLTLAGIVTARLVVSA
jgi:CrcB protein